MKRKVLAVLLCAAMTVSMLGGCGSKEAEAPAEAPAETEEPAEAPEEVSKPSPAPGQRHPRRHLQRPKRLRQKLFRAAAPISSTLSHHLIPIRSSRQRLIRQLQRHRSLDMR